MRKDVRKFCTGQHLDQSHRVNEARLPSNNVTPPALWLHHKCLCAPTTRHHNNLSLLPQGSDIPYLKVRLVLAGLKGPGQCSSLALEDLQASDCPESE